MSSHRSSLTFMFFTAVLLLKSISLSDGVERSELEDLARCVPRPEFAGVGKGRTLKNRVCVFWMISL